MTSANLYKARLNFKSHAETVKDLAYELYALGDTAPDARAVSLLALQSAVGNLFQAHYEWDQAQTSFRTETKPIGIR